MFIRKFLQTASDRTAPVLPEEARLLRSKPVAGYFADDLAAVERASEIHLPAESVKRLLVDFDRLLRYRRNVQGFSKAQAFGQWWALRHGEYLTRPVVAGYRESGLTLGELLDETHLVFVERQLRERDASRVSRAIQAVFRNRAVLAAAFTAALVFNKSLGFLWSLMVLGPGVQMVNSYTQPVITPLAQTAQQKGSQDLAPVASGIQSWLTNRSQLQEVARDLADTTRKLRKASLKGYTRAQAQAKWSEFEQVYFQLFLRYNQTLPSHLRDGRGYFRDWMIVTPVGLAANISSFDTQYWTHARELKQTTDPRLISLHKRQMRAAESRIAGALAAWKLYEFMYPEFAIEPIASQSASELRKSYRSFMGSMRLDVYVEQFAHQVEAVLRQLDADFIIQDRLAGVGSGPARSVASVRQQPGQAAAAAKMLGN